MQNSVPGAAGEQRKSVLPVLDSKKTTAKAPNVGSVLTKR